MIILLLIVLLFILFSMLRRHIGIALLATIAGNAIYSTFGNDLTELFAKFLNGIPENTISSTIYISLVFLFPLILYFKSNKDSLFGILRFLESLIYAVLLVSICAAKINLLIPFYDISIQLRRHRAPLAPAFCHHCSLPRYSSQQIELIQKLSAKLKSTTIFS